ncbi:MAG: hypothetical protein Q9M40_11865 [Sulfurimonas sp.]|nr:hypothetical protein [Sulfurimonas sp.]
MKINSLITLALFFSISFSVLHDFTIDIFDSECSTISHYVNETSYNSDLKMTDMSALHYFFHAPMLLTLYMPLPLENSSSSKIQTTQKIYSYTSKNTLFNPPII